MGEDFLIQTNYPGYVFVGWAVSRFKNNQGVMTLYANIYDLSPVSIVTPVKKRYKVRHQRKDFSQASLQPDPKLLNGIEFRGVWRKKKSSASCILGSKKQPLFGNGTWSLFRVKGERSESKKFSQVCT